MVKYELDKDIPEMEWSQYLKKYENLYQIYLDNERNWVIKCSRGKIGTYSILKKRLYFTTVELSKNSKTYFLKKIRKEADLMIVISQDGDYEFSINFEEENLQKMVELLEVRKKMNLSEDERLRRSKIAHLNFKKGEVK